MSSSGTLAASADTGRSRTDHAEPDRADLERAIVQALAYADVFDYALTADEIHRYLIGVPARRGIVRAVLANSRPAAIARSGRYFTLVGHESSVDTRRARAASAAA